MQDVGKGGASLREDAFKESGWEINAERSDLSAKPWKQHKKGVQIFGNEIRLRHSNRKWKSKLCHECQATAKLNYFRLGAWGMWGAR